MIGVLVFAFALARRSWFPPIASAHGVEIQRMLDFTLMATGAFLVAGHAALAWLLLRRGPGPHEAAADPSRRARRLVSVLPALLMAAVAEGGVLVLALPVWARYYGPPPADAVPVEVTGRQFFWVVRYPGPDGVFGRTAVENVGTENPLGLDRQSAGGADDVVLLNEMHVPKDRPVLLRLRSTDVIHSFWVPELRLKQNLVPGMSIEVWFTPTRAGAYELACNQICGLGHYRMRGLLHVDEADAFARWLGEQGAES
jgi:cytochrome c oxidase subunit 2